MFTNVQTVQRKFTQFSCLLLLVTLIFTSCQKESVSSLEEQVTPKETKVLAAKESLKALIQEKQIVSLLDAAIANPSILRTMASSNARSKNATSIITSLMQNESFLAHRADLKSAINPDDFECGPTFLNDYVRSITEDFTADDFFFLNNFGDIPTFEAFLLDNTAGGDYYGANGEYTNDMRRTFINLKRFWDIPTDIQMADMHGAVYQDIPTVVEVLKLLYGNVDENGNFIPISQEEAVDFAQFLKFVFGGEAFQNYSHPLLTFNAFATTGIPQLGVGKKIVMGDGIMEAYRSFGFRTVADKFVLAHEYGHHIQFANGYIGPDRTPEEGRRVELMADTYAAYYLAHGKGAFVQPILISQFARTAASVGDCGFDSPGHHGTPNQRESAADLGGELAERKSFLDPAYSSQDIFELFEEALPVIIEADAN